MGQPISTLLPDKGLYIGSRLAGNPSLVCNMFHSLLTKPEEGKSPMFLLVMMDVSTLATQRRGIKYNHADDLSLIHDICFYSFPNSKNKLE